jgi:hypothetical protein
MKRIFRTYQSIALITAIALTAGMGTAHGAATCNLNATTANFSAQVSAAGAGQTICLASGSYGTWSGTNKAVTITPAAGASVTIDFDFRPGTGSFTVDGTAGGGFLTIDGANITGPTSTPRNITIRNSAFTGSVYFDSVTNSNIMLDHNSHDWNAVYDGSINAKIAFLYGDGGDSGVTIKNSTIRNGNLDGVHTGEAIHVLNNIFDNLCDTGTNHTDNIQFEGATGGEISGNYIHESSSCDTQGITSFDSGTIGVVIQNNVVDIHRPWGIEFYSDKNSVIRHNTIMYHPPSDCAFNQECGQIDINRKPADPAGSGTHVYDNVTTDVGFNSGSTGSADHNVLSKTVAYQGGASPTTHDGFLLAAGSAGKGAASDGTDVGVYALGTTPPPLTPPSSGGPAAPAAGSSKPAQAAAAPAATAQKPAAAATSKPAATNTPKSGTAEAAPSSSAQSQAAAAPAKAAEAVASTLHTSTSVVWWAVAAIGVLWAAALGAVIKLGLLNPRDIIPACHLAFTELKALLHRA